MDITEDFRQENNLKKYYGKYPGEVLKNDAKEGEHRGELTVKVYGILEDNPDGKIPRPIEVIAKPCFLPGFFFIPEVNDNVWVEFAAGDINNPIWAGVWYPQKKTPHNTEKEAPTQFQKVIRTASGHVIQLDDSESKEKIIITHKSGSNDKSSSNDKPGSNIMIDNDKLIIEHKSGSKIMIDNDNIIITHKEDSKIEINSKGNITITDNGGDTTIKSSKITLDSGEILLGGASHKLAYGDILEGILGNIINSLIPHTHPTGMGPSGPSIDLSKLASIPSNLKNSYSKTNKTE